MRYKNLIYIHGYGSNCQTSKAAQFKALANELGLNFVALDYDSNAPFHKIAQDMLIALTPYCSDANIFVGTSLGGFYAAKLASWMPERSGSVAVLMNPSLIPHRTLYRYPAAVGNADTYNTESALYELPKKSFVFLEDGDDVLDHGLTYTLLQKDSNYKGCEVKIISGGSHRFDNLYIVLDCVKGLCE